MNRVLITAFLVCLLITVSHAQSDLITVEPEIIDDYLTNPGIGWQDGDADQMLLPETVIYPERSQISWRELHPEPDDFRWDVIDELLARARRTDRQLSFRIYTMIGEGYGEHQVPEWVLERGATLTESGAPNYANCVYQAEWGSFVTVLRQRYDGNPNIAYIDISGYGNFNEWGWDDDQTEWDNRWSTAYDRGEATADDLMTLDGQARRRLADMFIGGAYDDHQCLDTEGEVIQQAYEYTGFQQTQLVMPYAGIRQSTQYVFTQRRDVGWRQDCLGRDSDWPEELADVLDVIWRNAPVVYEFCRPLDDNWYELADNILSTTHATLVHDNLDEDDLEDVHLEDLMRYVGYRFVMRQAVFPAEIVAGEPLSLVMTWQNHGYAPVYPRMGQDFQLHVYLMTQEGDTLVDYPLSASVADWMPADNTDQMLAPLYTVRQSIVAPRRIDADTVHLKVAIINRRTGQPIDLGIAGRSADGRYLIGDIAVR